MPSATTDTERTVPGLMLLPYLTDTLGVAPTPAGVILFAHDAPRREKLDATRRVSPVSAASRRSFSRLGV